jgi:hypothetical protein
LKAILVLIVALVGVMTLFVVATKGRCRKLAVSFLGPLRVTVHASVPVQSPLQPEKVLPLAAVAIRVTVLPREKAATHVPDAAPAEAEQLIPETSLATVPEPVPLVAIASSWVASAWLVLTRRT